jgi:arylsulfatase A-like enzyme
MIELAGAESPADQVLDGISYVKLLFGTATSLDRDALYWHFPGYLGAARGQWRTTPAGAVRSGSWKLLEFFEDGRLELYNLQDDVGERHDLSQREPAKTKELHDRLVAWRKRIDAPMPTANTAIERNANR